MRDIFVNVIWQLLKVCNLFTAQEFSFSLMMPCVRYVILHAAWHQGHFYVYCFQFHAGYICDCF
jgi:hypothetical protein